MDWKREKYVPCSKGTIKSVYCWKAINSMSITTDSSDSHKEWNSWFKRSYCEFLSRYYKYSNCSPQITKWGHYSESHQRRHNKEGLSCRNNFQVNRIKVLNALRWLQKNNVLYKDIVIDESRLSLMKNQTTCQLKNMNIVTTKDDNISKWNDR